MDDKTIRGSRFFAPALKRRREMKIRSIGVFNKNPVNPAVKDIGLNSKPRDVAEKLRNQWHTRNAVKTPVKPDSQSNIVDITT